MHALNPKAFARAFLSQETRDIVHFWARVDQQWLASHPHAAFIREHPGRAVPIRVYGDDGPFNKRASLLVLSICSAIAVASSTGLE
eukprot:849991-Alexandrium_andersonii.AAC.1